MFRFTIRDVLTNGLVVAIVVAMVAGYVVVQVTAIQVARESAELERAKAAANREP